MTYFEKIKATALADGMPGPLALLIAAQAVHETDNFKSAVFREDLNCFGYKYVKGALWQDGPGRKSTEGDHYAHYRSIANSVHEITAWIRRREKEGKFPALEQITSPVQYVQLLKKCGYYGDPPAVYLAGIDSALKHYNGGKLPT